MVKAEATVTASDANSVRAPATVSTNTVIFPGLSMRTTSAAPGGAPVLQLAPWLQTPDAFEIHSTRLLPTATTARAGKASGDVAVISAPPAPAPAVTSNTALVDPAGITTDAGTAATGESELASATSRSNDSGLRIDTVIGS